MTGGKLALYYFDAGYEGAIVVVARSKASAVGEILGKFSVTDDEVIRVEIKDGATIMLSGDL